MNDKLLNYTELAEITTFEERFNYLKLFKKPTEEVFGSLRQLNQIFYTSHEWRQVRRFVLVRDNGCNLGLPEYPILGKVVVHHMNPIDPHILKHSSYLALDPEFLITVSHETHLAIHYGLEYMEQPELIIRQEGDTKPW